MKTNLLLKQLAQRMDGDRKAMSQTRDILRSMIDRKLWKQMQADTALPPNRNQLNMLLEKNNIFSATSPCPKAGGPVVRET